MEAIVFFISAAIILAGGVGVIVVRNPVHAALSLVMTLFGVAVLFINLEAYFLAVVQVIVYAGAIVVLFLFVIMLVGVDKAEDVKSEPLIGQREFAVLAGIGLVALAIIIGFAAGGEVTGQGDRGFEIAVAFEDTTDVDDDGITDETIPPSQALEVGGIERDDSSNTKQLGRLLFTDYVFAFEITALLLTIAVVGAVVLARKPKGELEPIPDVETAWPVRPEPAPDEEVVTDIDEDDLEAAEAAGDDEDEGDDSEAGEDSAEAEEAST